MTAFYSLLSPQIEHLQSGAQGSIVALPAPQNTRAIAIANCTSTALQLCRLQTQWKQKIARCLAISVNVVHPPLAGRHAVRKTAPVAAMARWTEPSATLQQRHDRHTRMASRTNFSLPKGGEDICPCRMCRQSL